MTARRRGRRATILRGRLLAGGGILALVAAILVVGLARGGSDLEPTPEDEEAIRALLDRYRDAVATGELRTVCSEMIAPGALGERGVRRCARDLDRALREIEGVTQSIATGEIERIEVTDERRARVYWKHEGDEQPFSPLVEVEGSWYVDPREPD